jgi:hypothetical protein
MPSVKKLPLLEAIAPDGAKSLWVAAVEQQDAVAAVAAVVPANHSVRLLSLRLSLRRKFDVLQPGEVREVRL